MLNRGGNLKNVAEASRLLILACGRSTKNSLSWNIWEQRNGFQIRKCLLSYTNWLVVLKNGAQLGKMYLLVEVHCLKNFQLFSG